jgi:phosphoenolpyruvate-protein kinase (PTS system EI component)
MIELTSVMEAIGDFTAVAAILYIDGNVVFQYLLAVNRTNRHMSGFCRPHHPPVLCALKWVAQEWRI